MCRPIGVKSLEVRSNVHGISSTGTYRGDSDLPVECIDVCFNETTGGMYVLCGIWLGLKPGTINIVDASFFREIAST